MAATAARTVSLLDADPGLGRLLAGTRLELAQRHLTVRTHWVGTGPWDAERLRGAGPEHVGLLLLEGIVAREVVLSDSVSCELLGEGDLVRPWQYVDEVELLHAQTRWTVLDGARFAILDRRFAALLGQFPEVNAMLVDRLNAHAQRLAVLKAIAQLNGVDRRLLALFWHLAERWGRVSQDGIAVTLPVPHRLLAQLIGARRPTVSTALRQLGQRRELVRLSGETWLLAGDPIGLPEGEAARAIHGRRLRFRRGMENPLADNPGPAPAGTPPAELPATSNFAELHHELEGLRQANQRLADDYERLSGETRDLIGKLARDRARRAQRGE
jgi:CRP-like cAMP-binding protein